MYNILSFSSLSEVNNADLSQTSRSLVNGLKLMVENQWYICGNLVLNEGENPHKTMNSSPDEMDYKVLLKAALLLASENAAQPITVTAGFPATTYKIFREKAVKYINGTHEISFDASVFGGGGVDVAKIEVENVSIVPEIVGCTIALRKGAEKAQGKFFVLSFGFGTFESILSTEDGIVEQTMVSSPGLRYAVDLVLEALQKEFYLEFKNAHLLEDAFQKGYVILNRKKIDLRELRKYAIKTYYKEVISPALRKIITDDHLMKTNVVYLCGGGVNYADIVDCFNEEFADICQINFVEEPEYLAVKGYVLNSLRKNGGVKGNAFGIDIGNLSTRLGNLV